MALTKIELYLLKEVLTKIKYDELNERYILCLEDYIPLNLKASEIKVLRRLCKENDIFLEELPPVLKRKETYNLFKQYNQIKANIGKDTANKQLQSQLYEVRNEIVEGHMKLVYKLISRYFPQINKERDKEDIYQIGYECLIELIEKYDVTKNASFIFFINNYIMQNIIRKVYKDKSNVTNERAAELKRFKIAIEHFEEKYRRYPTKEEMMRITKMEQEQIEHLLLIEKFLEPVPVDYEQDKDIPYGLIDYEFESREIDALLGKNDHLNKMLELLPQPQQKIMKLYYGFEGGKNHSHAEIADIIGDISVQRVQQIRQHAIYLLCNSPAASYLEELYGKITLSKGTKDGQKAISIYQTFIDDLFIESIPKEELLSIINDMQTNYKEIMNLYYGLKDGIRRDYKEIGIILNIDSNKIRNMKNTSVNIVIKKYIQKHYKNAKNTNMQYLINNYLNDSKKIKH